MAKKKDELKEELPVEELKTEEVVEEVPVSTVTETGKKHPVRKAIGITLQLLAAAGLLFGMYALGNWVGNNEGYSNAKNYYDPQISDVKTENDKLKEENESLKEENTTVKTERDEVKQNALKLANKLGLANADLAALEVSANNIINNLGIIGITKDNLALDENGEIVVMGQVIKLSEAGAAKADDEKISADDFAGTNDKLLFTYAVLESGVYNQALTEYYEGIVAEKNAKIETLDTAIEVLTAAGAAKDAEIAQLTQDIADAEAAHQAEMEALVNANAETRAAKEAEYQTNLNAMTTALADKQAENDQVKEALVIMTADRDAEKARADAAEAEIAAINDAANAQNRQNINNNTQGQAETTVSEGQTLVADENSNASTPTGVADTGFGNGNNTPIIIHNNTDTTSSTTTLTFGDTTVVIPEDTAAQVIVISDGYISHTEDNTSNVDEQEQENSQTEEKEEPAAFDL